MLASTFLRPKWNTSDVASRSKYLFVLLSQFISLSLSLIFKTIVRNVTRVIFRNVYRSINLVDDDTELQLGGPACDISIFLHFYILQTFP